MMGIPIPEIPYLYWNSPLVISEQMLTWIYNAIALLIILEMAAMMTSSNGNLFRVTGLCVGNSPVNFPHKGQSRGPLMFFFYLRLNKRLSKHSWGWWFETPSRPLWRHCNAILGTGSSIIVTQYSTGEFYMIMGIASQEVCTGLLICRG